MQNNIKKYLLFLLAFSCFYFSHSQSKALIKIDGAKMESLVSGNLHGIFFEEISHGGEGGLYGELIQNRGFEESRLPVATTLTNGFIIPNRTPHFNLPKNVISDWKMEWPVKSEWPAWGVSTNNLSDITLSLTQKKPLNSATPNSLQVNINTLNLNGKNNVINEGFWGINTISGDSYNFSFYARTDDIYKGKLTVSLQSADGTILAMDEVPSVSGAAWKKYQGRLVAKQTDGKAKFVLSFGLVLRQVGRLKTLDDGCEGNHLTVPQSSVKRLIKADRKSVV